MHVNDQMIRLKRAMQVLSIDEDNISRLKLILYTIDHTKSCPAPDIINLQFAMPMQPLKA